MRWFAIGLLLATGCRVTDWRLWSRAETKSDAYEVTRIPDLPYYDGPQADRVRHRVDLFLPKGKKDFPVVVLVHGGAWMIGDNRACGLYTTVGEFFASQGIGAVLPNYRLSPGVKHPEHIKDLARAFAWTKTHIQAYGGDPKNIFLVGHSAGGHLVALLATDEQYLKANGCRTNDIRGVVGISGVYRIPPGDQEVELGGNSPRSIRFDELAPFRDPSSPRPAEGSRGLPVRVNVFGPMFGDHPLTRLEASPMHHVRPGLPPFLLLNAEKELPLLGEMGKEFDRLLGAHGCLSMHMTIAERNHSSIMFKAITLDDPAAGEIQRFIYRNQLQP